MKKILLTQNKDAIVDDQDYEYLAQWKWQWNGRPTRQESPKAHGELAKYVSMFQEVAKRKGLAFKRLRNIAAPLDGDHLNVTRDNVVVLTRSQVRQRTPGCKFYKCRRGKWAGKSLVFK